MMERAKSLAGPWESKQLNHVDKKIDKEPNQGGLIQLPGGDWWFVTHQGTGDWEGRAMVLLPVSWVDGWPIIGHVGADGIGTMIWSNPKTIAGSSTFTQQTDDDFNEAALPPQWEWNYQPRADKWSLSEHPGALRLHAFRPINADDLLKAGNTLTQRVIRSKRNVVIVKLDLSGMADGQSAGICHFAKGYSMLSITQSSGVRTIATVEKGKRDSGIRISASAVWLKSEWGFDGLSRFSFSLDGTHFSELGDPYQLSWGYYRGDRIGLYTFNDKQDSGYVDFSRFTYTFSPPPG